MSNKFDPMQERAALLEYYLPNMPSFSPEAVSPSARPGYVQYRIGSIVKLYWFGLGSQVQSNLREILHWMKGNLPPSADYWQRDKFHYREASTSYFHWSKSLGLAKWLLGEEPADVDFAHAVQVEWEGWRQASADEAQQDRANRQNILSERLAVALCADLPSFALCFRDATQLRSPFLSVWPMVEYGGWASAYLSEGNTRDQTFVAKGQDALRATLLPYFEPSSAWVEATLWLKAVYFDSGVTTTAEETILRAYDLMPGIPPPDFVTR